MTPKGSLRHSSVLINIPDPPSTAHKDIRQWCIELRDVLVDWEEVSSRIHNVLRGRDEPDCHPMSAITGLLADQKRQDAALEELEKLIGEIPPGVPGGPGGGTSVHNELSGRDEPDCHPMKAITGLVECCDEVKQSIQDILALIAKFHPLEIESFTVTPSAMEIGSLVATTVLDWVYNHTSVKAQTIEGVTLDPSLRTLEETHAPPLFEDRSWTLRATSMNDVIVEATATLRFMHKRYWGSIDSKSPSNSDILGLEQELSTTRVMYKPSVNIVAAKPYICLAWPMTAWGADGGLATNIEVGGFTQTDWTIIDDPPFSLVNASGHTEDYIVYVLNQENELTTSIRVS
jgi:hypothetical protein